MSFSPFTLFNAPGVRQKPFNTEYPQDCPIRSLEDLKAAVSWDYVGGAYAENRRGNANFQGSDVLLLDLDNDGGTAFTPEDVQKAFPGCCFALQYSRNHMREKLSGKNQERKPAVPRFHCLFPLSETCRNPAEYAALKQKALQVFPAFDDGAKDAARFFYGTENPQVAWFDGNLFIDDFLKRVPAPATSLFKAAEAASAVATPPGSAADAILAGNRNSELFKAGMRILDKHGETDAAKREFLRVAGRCSPPLAERELESIWSSCQQRLRQKIAAGKLYNPAELPADSSSVFPPQELSPLAEAESFLREHPQRFLYSSGLGWLYWDGRRWAEDKEGLKLRLDFQRFTQRQCAAARREVLNLTGRKADAKISHDEKEEKEAGRELAKWQSRLSFAAGFQNAAQVNGIVSLCRSLVPVAVEKLDARPELLNTLAGTVNLETGEILPHNPADLITKLCPFSPAPPESSPDWCRFLERFCCGDRDLQRYLQTVCGMAAYGKVFVESLIFCYGPGGNGKSSFWNSVFGTFGDYAEMFPSDAITTAGRNDASYHLASLRGVRLALAAELEAGKTLSAASLKQFCSTDKIRARQIYREPITFTPSHSSVIFANCLPAVSETDTGTWRRLCVVPLQAQFLGSGEVKNYGDYLLRTAGNAILGWIVQGAQLFKEQGFSLVQPAAVQAATADYKRNSDLVLRFLEDRCSFDAESEVAASVLQEEFRRFVKDLGASAISGAEFKRRCSGYRVQWHRDRTGKYFRGVRLERWS